MTVSSELVDMAAWEQDKENVRPSRKGRDPAKLAQAIVQRNNDDQMNGSQSFDEQRLSERSAFEARLSHLSTANEPGFARVLVRLWSEYVSWAVEWFPTDSQEERCLLERATSSLADCPDCRDDLQYLKLWLRLADLLKEPQEIFNFLWTREVGLGHIAFYEAWSTSLERQRRFDEAEEVLRVALARGVQPAARLDASREALAKRMRNRVLHSAEDLEAAAQESMVPLPLQRPTLNFLTAAESQSFYRPSERAYSQSVGVVTANMESSSVSSFGCFDESISGDPPRASIFDAQSVWLVAPTKERVTSKENAGPRAGAIGPSNRPRRRNATRQPSSVNQGVVGDIAVFVDEDLRDSALSSPPTRRTRTAKAARDTTDGRCINDAPMPSSLPVLEHAARTPLGTHPNHKKTNGTPILAAHRAPPDAPNRELRRRRLSEPQDATNDLAAVLSGLRLSDQPPHKKARGVSAFQSALHSTRGEPVTIVPSTLGFSTTLSQEPFSSVFTPPRIRAASLRSELFGETSGPAPPPAAPSPETQFFCSRSCLLEPRRLHIGFQGDKSSSSGHSPITSSARMETSPSMCSQNAGGLGDYGAHSSSMSVFEESPLATSLIVQRMETRASAAGLHSNSGGIGKPASVQVNSLHSQSSASSRLLVFED